MLNLNFAHNQYWKWLILLPVLLVGLLFTFVPLPTLAFIGYVDAVNGPSTAVSLNGQKAIVSVGKQLKEGNRIRVLQSDTSVTLLLGSQRVQITHTHNNPYTVPKLSPPKSGFFKVVSNLVTDLFHWNYSTTMAMTKDGSCRQPDGTTKQRPSIPLLNVEKNAKLLAGERPLSFGWVGGSSPYKVQIYRQINGNYYELSQLQTIFTQKCASLKEVMLPNWNFKERERYKVKVTDKTQQVAEGQFAVVSRRDDPRLQWTQQEFQELKASSLLRAIWLVQQEWRLEAYQQFLGVKMTHSAKIVKRGLAEAVSLPIE